MKKVFKWTGIVICSLIVLFVGFYGVVYMNIDSRINKRYAFGEETIAIPTDSATLVLGAHLVAIKGCLDCHGPDLGGRVMINEKGLGVLTAPNLTRGLGGLPDDYGINHWVTALRHGVTRSGRPLLLMPSHESTLLKEQDLAAIIAYCQQLPRVDKELPANEIGPIVRIMTFFGKMPLLAVEMIDHDRMVGGNTVASNLIAEGKYLAISCKGCHRDNMQGGSALAPGMPEVPDITARGKAGSWTKPQFTAMLRTGKRPDGSQVSNDNMPWKMTAQYTDGEIDALYAYLQSLK